MISSPCKSCEKKHLSKDRCIDTCELIHRIQTVQFNFTTGDLRTVFDSTEEYRLQAGPRKSRSPNAC